MRILQHLLFWVVISLFLILTFGKADHDYVKAFYFVSFLLPVAVSTSYFFNYYLVPTYLMKKRYLKFILYFIYTLIFSLNMEFMVITVALIVLANYHYENLNPYTGNIFLLTGTLYFMVFLNAFLQLIRRHQQKEQQIHQLEGEKLKNQTSQIVVRSDRKNIPIALEKIQYIESLADYVKIHINTEAIITKEKISQLENRLPNDFIRVHRSFLVNRNHIYSFNKEEVMIQNTSIPISRTYRKKVNTLLETM